MPEPEPQPEPQSQPDQEQQLQPQPQFSFSSQPLKQAAEREALMGREAQTAPAEQQELAELGHLQGFDDDGPWVDQLAWLESRLAAQQGLVVLLQR